MSSTVAKSEPKKRSSLPAKPSANGDIPPTAETPKEAAAEGHTSASGDLRKGLATSTVAYQRKRKHVSRPETPRWQTLLSILTKLCLLVVGLVWLGQMIMKMSNGNADGYRYRFSDLESDGRIAEVESFVKKTAKMLQVQLDVVDKKIGSEVAGLKNELHNKIDERSVVWEKQVKKLEEKAEGLGKSIGELKEMGVLTKEEFEGFKNELKKRRGFRGEDASLDEIGALAKEIVEKEIEKHAADGLGRVDYAVGSGGARVIAHSAPFVNGKVSNWFSTVGKERSRVHSNAKKMLEPSFGEPGQCFALQGSSGYVDVRLRTGIVPEAVTLEHVSKSVAYDRSSAPKDCMVLGWSEGSGEPAHPRLLTKFFYDLEKSNAQTFNVDTTNNDVGVVNVVRLEFASNHGNPSLTCIYRFRVHGREYSTPQIEEANSLAEAESSDSR